MILHLYFARRFTVAFVFLSTVFYALVVLVDLIEQTRKFSGLNVSLKDRNADLPAARVTTNSDVRARPINKTTVAKIMIKGKI